MKKIFYCFSLISVILSLISCTNNGNSENLYNQNESSTITNCTNVKSNANSFSFDENYKNSIEREEELRDAGMDNAANIERRAREEYIEGGGYTSKDGGRQIHYQGSKEQEDDLKMIDEYFGF